MPEPTYWDEENDTRPWDELTRENIGRVADLVEYLLERSSHYARRLKGHQPRRGADARWLTDLPYTVKDDIRDAQGEIVDERPLGSMQCAPTGDLVQVTSSSGTTGTPVFFGLTARDLQSWRRSVGNALFTCGVGRASTVALTTGMPMVAGGLPYADAIREVGGGVVWLGGQTTARMIDAVARLRVDTLIGTVSFDTFFADACEEALGRDPSTLHVRTLIGGGEPGLAQPEIRRRLAERWGATRVSEMMGLGDVLPALWGECEHAGGMHFTAGRDVLVELVDPETGEQVPWEAGAEGEAIYTTLDRQASPVLRYRSRDHLQVLGTTCGCGRTAPRIRCIGRTDDMLIYKAMNVFPTAIRDVAMSAAGDRITGVMRIRKAQAGQVRFDDPIPLELEIADGMDAERTAAITGSVADAVRQRLRVRVTVESVAAGSLPVGTYKTGLTYVAEPGGTA